MIEEPDSDLTEEQLILVNQLSNEQLKEIDEMLLSFACNRWRKVARIVASTMFELPLRIKGIPDVFYAQRIKKLVDKGVLESQGNLKFMRYSEVRLPLK